MDYFEKLPKSNAPLFLRDHHTIITALEESKFDTEKKAHTRYICKNINITKIYDYVSVTNVPVEFNDTVHFFVTYSMRY